VPDFHPLPVESDSCNELGAILQGGVLVGASRRTVGMEGPQPNRNHSCLSTDWEMTAPRQKVVNCVNWC